MKENIYMPDCEVSDLRTAIQRAAADLGLTAYCSRFNMPGSYSIHPDRVGRALSSQREEHVVKGAIFPRCKFSIAPNLGDLPVESFTLEWRLMGEKGFATFLGKISEYLQEEISRGHV